MIHNNLAAERFWLSQEFDANQEELRFLAEFIASFYHDTILDLNNPDLKTYSERHKYLTERQNYLSLYQQSLQSETDRKHLSIKKQLRVIQNELLAIEAELENEIEIYGRITIRGQLFLANRKKYLEKLKNQLTALQTKLQGEETQKPESRIKRICTKFLNYFNIAKKPIDLTDDLWYPVQNAVQTPFTTVFGRYLIGSISLIIQPVEALTSLMKAKRAYQQDNIDTTRRAVKMTTNLTSFGLGAGGTALAILIILIASGITFSGSAIIPAIPPMILLGIYTLRFLDSIDNYRFRRKNLIAAKKEYEICTAVTNIVKKVEKGQGLNKDENDLYSEYTYIAKLYGLKPHKITDHQILLERTQQNYLYAKTKAISARRKIAFSSIEVLATALVVIGTVMGAAAIIGASGVATFGVAPTVIISLGVAIGFGLKIYQMADKKYHLTDKIERKCKEWFTKISNYVLGRKPEPKPEAPKPAPAKLSGLARMFKAVGATAEAACKGADNAAPVMLATQPIAIPSTYTPAAKSSYSPKQFKSYVRPQPRPAPAYETLSKSIN